MSKYFKLNKKEVQTEILAGITSFFAISYIIIVNPMILSDAGIPAALSVFATIFSSVIGCLIMGLWANTAIILTPGMGVNAFFTYTVVVGMHLTWHQALAISIFSSVLYLIVAFTKIGTFLSNAIPDNLKHGITAGIGLFLVTLGLEKGKLIQSGGKHALLMAGNFAKPEALLALFGLLLTIVLYLKRVKGDFIIGIIVTSIIGDIFHVGGSQVNNISLTKLVDYHQLIFKADFSQIFDIKFLLAVFSMSMILIFESMGLLEGLLINKTKFKKAFQASSITAVISGFLGTSPTVAAAESAAGIETGGRTGLADLVSAGLFFISLFLIPLLSFVPQAAIAPVIIITGALMMEQIANISVNDFSEWFPAFLIIVLIPLTGSISTGLAFGFVAYPIVKLARGKDQEIHPVLYLLGVLFLIELVFNSLLM